MTDGSCACHETGLVLRASLHDIQELLNVLVLDCTVHSTYYTTYTDCHYRSARSPAFLRRVTAAQVAK